MNYDDLESNPAFDKKQLLRCQGTTDTEYSQTERSEDDANNQRHIEDNE
jgi:hypothetical protein